MQQQADDVPGVTTPPAPMAVSVKEPVAKAPEAKPFAPVAPGASSIESDGGERLITRREPDLPSGASVMPKRSMLSRLEDTPSQKDFIRGRTTILDPQDEAIGRYSSRLLEAVRGRWKLVGSRFRSGHGLLSIQIYKDGSIAHVDVVESSGNSLLDTEIVETVKNAGYVGPLPRSWPHERFQTFYAFSAGSDAAL